MSALQEGYFDPETEAIHRRVLLGEALAHACFEYDRVQREITASTLLRIQGGPYAQLPNIDTESLARVTNERLSLMEQVMLSDAELRQWGINKTAEVKEILEGKPEVRDTPLNQRIVAALWTHQSPELSLEEANHVSSHLPIVTGAQAEIAA